MYTASIAEYGGDTGALSVYDPASDGIAQHQPFPGEHVTALAWADAAQGYAPVELTVFAGSEKAPAGFGWDGDTLYYGQGASVYSLGLVR